MTDNQEEYIEIWLGKEANVDVYIDQNIYKTIKKAKKKLLKVSIRYNGPIESGNVSKK